MNLNQLATLLRLYCPKHEGEPLNMFCDHDKCDHKGLVCALCEVDEHTQHSPLSLKILLKDIHQDLEEFSAGKSLVRLAAEIDYEYTKCVASSQKLKNKESIQILRESIKNYFGKLKNMVLKPKAYDLQQMIERLRLHAVDLKEINQLLLSYRNLYRDIKPPSDSSNYLVSLTQTIQDLKHKHSELEKAIIADDKMENILQIYVSAETSSKVTYFFSESMKHTSHTVTNKNTIVQNNNYNTNLALIQPSIEGSKISSNRSKSINIKLTRLTSWISLGICHQNIAKGALYYFNTGSIGHGAYVVSNDGYSWHSSNSSMNSFYNAWTFEQGDVINVTVNLKSKTIRFSKVSNPDSHYEMNFDTVPGDKLFFCVSLSSHNESVEIMNA